MFGPAPQQSVGLSSWKHPGAKQYSPVTSEGSRVRQREAPGACTPNGGVHPGNRKRQGSVPHRLSSIKNVELEVAVHGPPVLLDESAGCCCIRVPVVLQDIPVLVPELPDDLIA